MTDAELKEKLIEQTRYWTDFANQKLNRSFKYPIILFDLRGTTAGQAWTTSNKIRYNLGIARDNFNAFIDRTVPHEVAHLVADQYFMKNCGHGTEWKWVMGTIFGKEVSRCHSYDVTKHRVRKTKIYIYQCSCLEGCKVGAKHHKLIQTKQYNTVYCKTCRMIIDSSSLVKQLDRNY